MYVPITCHPRRRVLTAGNLASAMALVIAATFLTGCVSIPPESVSARVEADELSAHVHFLTQPALKGRKPKTRGSSLARRYITDRFERYGLVPWGQAKRYTQSFGLGTNVIGVLPGADPNLAEEVVIVAAHYDHLGKTDKGLCLGAALLEIAEHLALMSERPRRSVCFAAFDCEETFTLGAFAFTCRYDCDEARIAGVVNIDMLGRDAFGVLDNHLFMTGTEGFPDLRKQIRASVPEGIALLPLGTEIAGPRGDHIAFETLERPVLFFSCGPHADYHRPSDTPQKLDYACIQESVKVIAGAVEALADSDQPYRRDTSHERDLEELQAVKSCLSQIRQGHGAMGWTEAQAGRLDPVIEQVDHLLGERRYTLQDRLRLLRTAAQPLIPLMLWPDSVGDPNDPNQPALSDFTVFLQTLYTEHRPFFVRAARAMLKDVLSQPTNFLLGRTINRTYVFTDVPDHLIFLEAVEPSEYRLEFLHLTFSVGVRISGPSRVGLQVGCNFLPAMCTGTKDELTDYCLLLCRCNAQDTQAEMWLRVMRHVTGEKPTTYEEALRPRPAKGSWVDERAWILDCVHSRNRKLRYMAIVTLSKVLGSAGEPTLLGVLADPSSTVDDHQAVIRSINADSSAELLAAVARILSDQTEIKCRQQKFYEILTRPGTPFEGYPLLPLTVKSLKAWIDKEGQTPWTMADLAQERLGFATSHRFDKDVAAARQWIEANWPPKSN
ncbi:MAG: M28 family peptidase [Sedimentisphaerales bacterium]|nr:M28 family peptidase [Sedimentisphaerales bacterium]